MTRKPPLMAWAALLSGAILLLVTARNLAQDHAAEMLALDEAVAIEAAVGQEVGKTDDPPSLREQTIYIPYEDLRKTFEKEGRGVFLPYAKFRELWDAARQATRPVDAEKPPVGAVLIETAHEASVAKDVVQVMAKVQIELLTPGWHEIDLRLPDAAITEATIDGQPARIRKAASGSGYALLLEKKGQEPEQVTLNLRYAKAIERSPGHNSVAFDVPPAPISRWTVRIPESGVKVDFYPLIAATEVEKPQGVSSVEADGGGETPEEADGGAVSTDETVVLAFVGAAPTVRIGWTPKAEGATGLEALAAVQSEQQVMIDEGVVRTRTRLDYTISRAEMDRLAIEVPGDQRVVDVFDPNIRKFNILRGETTQTIDIELFDPAKASQSIVVELEKFDGNEKEPSAETAASAVTRGASQTVVAPVVKALGVGRQQGIVVVRVGEGLTAEKLRSIGLLQIDRGELSPRLAGQAWDFAYRFASVPYTLDLAIDKIQPRIQVDSLVEAKLDPERVQLDVSSCYTIERAGVFQLQWSIPEGYAVRRVTGLAIQDAQPMAVETYHVEPVDGSEEKRLTVNLINKALGKAGLLISLERRLNEPDLLTPTGEQVALELTPPLVLAGTVQRAVGRLIVHAPESLRLNPTTTEGLQAVSFQEAMADLRPYQPRSDLRPVLTYTYGVEASRLALQVERRKPQVTIRQLLAAKIEDGVVKYRSIFFYDIKYSGVKVLRVDIPAELAATMRNETTNVRDAALQPRPEDVPEGYVAWQFTGERELQGTGHIELTWEKKLEQLGVGGTVEIEIPRLIPMGVDRAHGQIVLSKAETIDLHEAGSSEGLRPIDAQRELMPGANITDGAAAFEFHGPWRLTITATRYELADIKQTSIERAVVRAVVHRSSGNRAESMSVQAIYRIRSARQRIQMKLPVGSQITRSQLGGRPILLETEQGPTGTHYYVPLVGATSDTPIVFELQYTYSSQGDSGSSAQGSAAGIRVEYPTFPLEPAMQECYLCVYLPEEWDLISADGPWTQRFDWQYLASRGRYVPLIRPSEYELLRWVTEGHADGSGNILATFPTDGVIYLFSSLQPGDPDSDALRLATMRQWVLDAIVLGLVVLAGVLLLPMRALYRLLAIVVLVIGGILITLFQPILAHQVGDRTLYLAVYVVIALWIAQFLIWTLPRSLAPWIRHYLGSGTGREPCSAVVGGSASAGTSVAEVGAAEAIVAAEAIEPAGGPWDAVTPHASPLDDASDTEGRRDATSGREDHDKGGCSHDA